MTEERAIVIPEQTVTTQDAGGLSVASLTVVQDYSNDPPETLTVTFNGVEYNLTRSEPVAGCFLYGDYGFTDAPFALRIDRNAGSYISNLITATPQTVTIKAEVVIKSLEITDDFAHAVRAVYNPPSLMTVTADFEGADANEKNCTMSNTVGEILAAYDSGANVHFLMHDTVTDVEYDIPLGSVVYYETSRQIKFQAFTDDPYYILSFKTNTETSSNACYYDVFTIDLYSGGIG